MLVSLAEKMDEHDILFYPNPCNDQGIMELSFETTTDVCYVLYDLYGRALIKNKLQNRSNYRERIDLVQFPPGIYNLYISKRENGSEFIRSIKIIRK